MKSDNMHNKDLGYAAEKVARKYYENKGWSLLAENETARGSELDLVMEKSGKSFVDIDSKSLDITTKNKERGGVDVSREILFVEVKSAAVDINGRFGYDNIRPEDNFTKSKQKYFKRGIELYLTKNKLNNITNLRIRIDLACVYCHTSRSEDKKWTIKTYENIILD